MPIKVETRKHGDPCPECGGEVTFGYGLAGGGDPGGYEMCLECDWFLKPEGGEPSCFPFQSKEEGEQKS